MKLEITPVFQSSLSADNIDKNSLTGIILKDLPPVCPFCGEHMTESGCVCREFRTAYKNLLRQMDISDEVSLSIGYPESSSAESVISLSSEQVCIETVPAKKCSLSLFTGGKMSLGFEVSLADQQNRKLDFWLRLPGGSQVYHFKLHNVNYPSKAKNIYFYRIEQNMVSVPGRKFFGRCRIEYKYKILKKLSCTKFLKLLKN